MMQTEVTLDTDGLQAKGCGNANGANMQHIITRERTRTSAKEAVSSRWESRAKASAAKKTMNHHDSSGGLGRGSTSTSTSTTSPSLSSESDSARMEPRGGNGNDSKDRPSNLKDQNQRHAHDHPHNKVANANLHPICQTWRHVQNAIGWRLLRHLEKEQKLHASPGPGPGPGPGPAKLKQKHKQRRQEPHTKKNVIHKTNKNKKTNVGGGRSMINANGNLHNNAMHLSQDKEKNKKKKRAELAETIADLQATTAIQNQLSDITNGESKHYLKSVLSILPAAYGFDERSALNSTIVLQNRKRAFLLLDLGRVIRAHAQFITMTCGFESKGLKTRNGGGNMHLPPTHKLRRTGMNVNNVARTRRGVYIQPQFQVTKNPSMELLKLFARLGVDLRCNSSDDVLVASQAVAEERRERHGNVNEDAENAESSMHSVYGEEVMPLVDDVSKTRKPDGYFRRLLHARSVHTACDMNHVEVAVDSADEVQRISNTVRTFAQRRSSGKDIGGLDSSNNNNGHDQNGCRFLLRLPSISKGQQNKGQDCKSKLNDGAWERLVLSVHEAAMKEDGELVGVSVDLTPWSNMLASAGKDIPESASNYVLDSRAIIKNIFTHLRLFRLLMLSVGQYHIRIDMTGLPNPLTREHCQVLTQTLKEIVCSNVTIEELKQLQVSSQNIDRNNSHGSESDDSRPSSPSSDQIERIVNMANDPSTCSLIFTADISHQLVARAGALCTRIIGVKASKGTQHKEMKTGSDMAGDKAVSNTAVAKHYYIDDGCYGSLGSSKCGSENCGGGDVKHVPVPMYGDRPLTKSFFRSLQAPRSMAVTSSSNSPSPLSSTPRASSPSPDSMSASDTPLLQSEGTGQCGDEIGNNCKNIKSTVWGPTCDGLDKVCESVFLPDDLKSNRDWLIFSNLGCGGFGGLGLGTAFNGFDPPDVAYCVLGYFSGASGSWA